MDEVYYVGVDLGGTRLRVCLACSEGVIVGRWVEGSPLRPYREGIWLDYHWLEIPMERRLGAVLRDRVCGYLEEGGISSSAVRGIGVSVPGRITGRGHFWGGNTPLRLAREGNRLYGIDAIWGLEDAFPRAVSRVENDGNAIARLQARYWQEVEGIAPERTFYLTLSTGVGGGNIFSIPNEVGHIRFSQSPPFLPPECGCGGRYCVEAFSSGTGLVRRAERIFRAYLEGSSEVEDWYDYERGRNGWVGSLVEFMEGSSLYMLFRRRGRIEAEDIFEGVGYPLSKEDLGGYLLWEAAEQLAYLALALAQVFGTEYIGVGGGIAFHNPCFLGELERFLGRLSTGDMVERLPRFFPTPLRDLAGDYASLYLVQERVFEFLLERGILGSG